MFLAMSNRDNYLLFSRGYTIHKVPYIQTEDDTGARVLYKPGNTQFYKL